MARHFNHAVSVKKLKGRSTWTLLLSAERRYACFVLRGDGGITESTAGLLCIASIKSCILFKKICWTFDRRKIAYSITHARDRDAQFSDTIPDDNDQCFRSLIGVLVID